MEVADVTLGLLIILFFVAVCAGFVDTLAGGGGLITLPALTLAGLPPLFALGTNKLQGCVGTATATFYLFRKRKLRWRNVKVMMLAAFIGSAVGAIAIQFINTDMLELLIPIVLFGIGLYFIFPPRLPTDENPREALSKNAFNWGVVPVIGAYDGALGPGTGSFYSLVGVSLRKQNLIDATFVAKSLNFATNVASLIVFTLMAKISWKLGAAMMCGQVCGATLGARSLLIIKVHYLRYIIVAVSFLMLTRYLVSHF